MTTSTSISIAAPREKDSLCPCRPPCLKQSSKPAITCWQGGQVSTILLQALSLISQSQSSQGSPGHHLDILLNLVSLEQGKCRQTLSSSLLGRPKAKIRSESICSSFLGYMRACAEWFLTLYSASSNKSADLTSGAKAAKPGVN